jgi:ABC-type molybdate transport system ATPase subunit
MVQPPGDSRKFVIEQFGPQFAAFHSQLDGIALGTSQGDQVEIQRGVTPGDTVVIGGQDVSRVPPNRRPTNMVFQDYALFPHLDVAGNVGFSLRERRMKRPEIRARVSEALRAEFGRRNIGVTAGA